MIQIPAEPLILGLVLFVTALIEAIRDVRREQGKL